MNKLIVIVGPSGVGKTSLVRALKAHAELAVAYEEHEERPFQLLFKQDSKYALANQLDYLIFRAEQERELREWRQPSVMDGGLDLDFQGFTRLFHSKGLLTASEFALCERFYEHTRALLPPPELIVSLAASDEIIRARLGSRKRINIASAVDTRELTRFIRNWLETLPRDRVLQLDVTDEDGNYERSVAQVLARM